MSGEKGGGSNDNRGVEELFLEKLKVGRLTRDLCHFTFVDMENSRHQKKASCSDPNTRFMPFSK